MTLSRGPEVWNGYWARGEAGGNGAEQLSEADKTARAVLGSLLEWATWN